MRLYMCDICEELLKPEDTLTLSLQLRNLKATRIVKSRGIGHVCQSCGEEKVRESESLRELNE